jgi:predicted nicotinamide N-methyase
VKLPSEKLLNDFAPLTPVSTCPRIAVHQAPDFYRLWDALEHEQGSVCDVPFWAAVWPGAKSLSRYILNNPDLVKGKSILDLGCGSGVVSIAASKAGAVRVVANDIDPVALHIAERDFLANGVSPVLEKRNFLEEDVLETFDLVFVVDMFYERSKSPSMLALLKDLRRKGIEIIIADGSRPFAPKDNIELLLNEWIEVDRELEGVHTREVRIFRFEI